MRTILYSLAAFLIFLPVAAFAQDDNNLVNLPIGETGDFNDYINAVYLMFISIAALIAVVKIIIAGVKYMFTDIVTQKGEAKRDIQGALLGLLVVLSAVIVLSIINPDLTTFDPDIVRNEAREGIAQSVANGTSGFTAQDITTIEQVCAEGLVSCDIQACDALDFGDEGSTFIETIANYVGADYILNRTNCGVTCDLKGGEIIGGNSASGQCISPKTEDIQDLEVRMIAEIMNNSPACDNGCQNLRCPFVRTQFTCSSWCEDQGGTNINLQVVNGAARCIVPVAAGTDTSSFDCAPSARGEFNCRAAVQECLSYGKTPEPNPGINELVSYGSISCN
jgi:hypothetical protein